MLVREAVSRFIWSAGEIIMYSYLTIDSGHEVLSKDVTSYALDSKAAPCATTERNVPFSQIFALFSEPTVWIKSLWLREITRVSV